MLWLAAYLTGFPSVGLHVLRWTHGLAPMWAPMCTQFSTGGLGVWHPALFIATSFVLPNSTPFDIIRTFVHTLLTIPDPRELFSTRGLAPGIFSVFPLIKLLCTCPTKWWSVNALSGLYLTSTKMYIGDFAEAVYVSMPSRAYTSLLLYVSIARRMQNTSRVNALSGLYLTSTSRHIVINTGQMRWCQCPLGLIPHFYGTPSKT